MSESTAVATSDRKAITTTVATRYGMEADTFEAALRNTVFLEGSKAEYAAFLVVCNEYKLNPLTKEICAFKNKAGKFVPVVSIDGWVSLCNTHPQFDGMTFEDLHDDEGKLYAITCTIYRRDRSHPTVVTEYLSECVRNTEPWKMQHRMLRHKSLIQTARYAFGFSGIYDQDEAERVEISVLPEGDGASLLAAPGFEGAKARRPRKGATPEPEEPTHEVAENAEFEDACQHTFEKRGDDDVCVKCGFVYDGEEERPFTQAADTETAGAQTAGAEPDTQASAETAAEDSQALKDSSPATASQPTSAGSTAPADVVYRLMGDPILEDGKLPTWKNGQRFSSVKPEAKVMPPVYEHHPRGEHQSPATSSALPEQVSEFEDEAQEVEPRDEIAAGLAAIAVAPHYPAAVQVQTSLMKTEAWGVAPAEVKAGVRLAIWKRYTELKDEGVETIEPSGNFGLMRAFLDFGARNVAEIDAMWTKFFVHASYKTASDGDRKAISLLRDRRAGELKEPE